jgi:hypothetical protein
VDARQIPGSGRDAAVLKKFGRLVESSDDLGFRVASAGSCWRSFHPRSNLVGGPVRDWQLAAHLERLEVRLLGLCSRNSATIFSECCQFADECRRNADKADDPSRKQFWLDMEERWLHLARSPAFLEQISNFNAATQAPVKGVGRPHPRLGLRRQRGVVLP